MGTPGPLPVPPAAASRRQGHAWSRATPPRDLPRSLGSAKTRQAALQSLRLAFSSKTLSEFLLERRLMLTDSLEKCLKKGLGTGRRWDWGGGAGDQCLREVSCAARR